MNCLFFINHDCNKGRNTSYRHTGTTESFSSINVSKLIDGSTKWENTCYLAVAMVTGQQKELEKW